MIQWIPKLWKSKVKLCRRVVTYIAPMAVISLCGMIRKYLWMEWLSLLKMLTQVVSDYTDKIIAPPWYSSSVSASLLRAAISNLQYRFLLILRYLFYLLLQFVYKIHIASHCRRLIE